MVSSKNSYPEQRIFLKQIDFQKMDARLNLKIPVEVVSKSLNLQDERLLQYYQNDAGKKVKSVFVQRISDSNTYVVLFPTGLLLIVNA